MEEEITCRICAAVGVKMYDLRTYPWENYFETITGISPIMEVSPNVCYQCAALMKKYYLFRQKCLRRHTTLYECFSKNKEVNPLTTEKKSTNFNLSIYNVPPETIYEYVYDEYEHVKVKEEIPEIDVDVALQTDVKIEGDYFVLPSPINYSTDDDEPLSLHRTTKQEANRSLNKAKKRKSGRGIHKTQNTDLEVLTNTKSEVIPVETDADDKVQAEKGTEPKIKKKRGPKANPSGLTRDEMEMEEYVTIIKLSVPTTVHDLNETQENRHPDKGFQQKEYDINKMMHTHGETLATKECIKEWVQDLKQFLIQTKNEDILQNPDRIFNGDQLSINICPRTRQVLNPEDERNLGKKRFNKKSVAIFLVISASGETVTPMVVYPFIGMPSKEVIYSVPDPWFIGRSKNGRMTQPVFYEYIANGFNNWLDENNIRKPVLVFVNGHESYLSIPVSEFCEKNGIILYALPHDIGNLMRPARVGIFRYLKDDWWQSLKERGDRDTVITKATFSPLLYETMQKDIMKHLIIKGFELCGLYPFNPLQ